MSILPDNRGDGDSMYLRENMKDVIYQIVERYDTPAIFIYRL